MRTSIRVASKYGGAAFGARMRGASSARPEGGEVQQAVVASEDDARDYYEHVLALDTAC